MSSFANVWPKIKQILVFYTLKAVAKQLYLGEILNKITWVNPLTAKLFNLNFHSLEVVSR